ncbi:hypothetical protein PUN28_006295 [Cardiocondyla obscurior]|uniref:SKA complex subunit 1 n=2 Tax=Cardiocondyla obscurior TaxID=286306 RepID=A0AAW2GE63_9HYME
MTDENKLLKQDESDSLEEIVNRQTEKLKKLDAATIFIRGKQDTKAELQRMHEEVLQLSCSINETKKQLDVLKEQNSRCREVSKLLEAVSKRIIHQDNNVPPELIQSYQNATITSNKLNYIVNSTQDSTASKKLNNSHAPVIEKQEIIKDCKRTLFNEPEICPTIQFITAEEFNKVPKYIIGRQTSNSLEIINNFISSINQTLIAKYTILSLGKAAAQKKGEINLYLLYKRQAADMREDNRYLYFFTTEDYYNQTKTKIDKTKLNLLTALRHCKRLRECRIKNELRYVITPIN